MRGKRYLTLGPNERIWVSLHSHEIREMRAAMIVADDMPPPEPGTLTWLGFFGGTRDEPEQAAKVYLGCPEPGS